MARSPVKAAWALLCSGLPVAATEATAPANTPRRVIFQSMGLSTTDSDASLARLSHSGWRVELPAGAGSTILVPGIRSRRRVSGGGGVGACPVLFVGGRNERSQGAAEMSW